MKHTNLDEWKKAVSDQGYTLKQVQGYEQFEALDGDRVVGRWNAEHGYLGEVQPAGPIGFGGAPILDKDGEQVRYDDNGPVVPETDVGKTVQK